MKTIGKKTFAARLSYIALAGTAAVAFGLGAQLPHLVSNWSGWTLIPDNAWTGKPNNEWTGKPKPINKQ